MRRHGLSLSLSPLGDLDPRFLPTLKIVLTTIIVLLGFSLAGNLFQLVYAWKAAELSDGRPAGAVFRTRQELVVFTRGSTKPVLTLPADVLLQESTPAGVATLGKFYGREFLFTVHSAEFEQPAALELVRPAEPPHFEAPYTFDSESHAP